MSSERRGQPTPAGPSRGPMGGPMAMGMPVQKAKNFKSTLKRLVGYLKPHKTKLLFIFLLAILSTLFSIVSPKILGKATTKLFEGIVQKAMGMPGAQVDFGYIGQIITLLAVLYMISAIFGYFQQYVMAGVAQTTVLDMRTDVNDKLTRLPLKFYDTHTHGEVLSRVTNDIDNISTTLQQSLTQLITSVVTIVGVVIMMMSISPTMTLIAVVTLPLSFAVTITIAKRSQKHFAAQQRTIGELNGHVEEMYTGHKIVKAFGHEQKSIHKFNGINNRLYDASMRAQFMSGLIMPLMVFVNNVGYVVVCIVGGIFVTRRAIEIGDIQAFIQYSRQFTWPIIQTANIANVIQSTVASAERVFELLDEVEEVPESPSV